MMAWRSSLLGFISSLKEDLSFDRETEAGERLKNQQTINFTTKWKTIPFNSPFFSFVLLNTMEIIRHQSKDSDS